MSDNTPSPPSPPTAEQARAARPDDAIERLRGRLMAQSLGDLLDAVPGARPSLPQLAALQAGLQNQGPGLLQGVSRPLLTKLCSQLESLPARPEDAPLQDLAERLMRALEAAPRSEEVSANRVNLQYLSDFVTDEKLVVAEASFTDFTAASEALEPHPPVKNRRP